MGCIYEVCVARDDTQLNPTWTAWHLSVRCKSAWPCKLMMCVVVAVAMVATHTITTCNAVSCNHGHSHVGVVRPVYQRSNATQAVPLSACGSPYPCMCSYTTSSNSPPAHLPATCLQYVSGSHTLLRYLKYQLVITGAIMCWHGVDGILWDSCVPCAEVSSSAVQDRPKQM